MNLPLLSPAALDNAVFTLVARELGVANAMRFIAQHNRSDGIDYTRDRNNWLPQGADDVERLLNESSSGFDQLMSGARRIQLKAGSKVSGRKRK